MAVDAAHIYWANARAVIPGPAGTIGRANLDGTGVDRRFITATGNPRAVAVDPAHVYWRHLANVGRANLDGTGVDRSFISDRSGGNSGVAVDALRSFSLGKVKKNKRKGTANLTVKVPGSGTLNLTRTESVKGARTFADVKLKAKLPIKPRREAKARLKRKGKAKVKAEVTYTPTGGDPTIVANTDTKTVKLVRR